MQGLQPLNLFLRLKIRAFRPTELTIGTGSDMETYTFKDFVSDFPTTACKNDPNCDETKPPWGMHIEHPLFYMLDKPEYKGKILEVDLDGDLKYFRIVHINHFFECDPFVKNPKDKMREIAEKKYKPTPHTN